MLLAHKSIKTTERHYAPWVKARQEQLVMGVRKSWAKQRPPVRRDRTPGKSRSRSGQLADSQQDSGSANKFLRADAIFSA
jgi:hypothetical protein